MDELPAGVFPRTMSSGEVLYQATAKIKGTVVWLGLWPTPKKAKQAIDRIENQ